MGLCASVEAVPIDAEPSATGGAFLPSLSYSSSLPPPQRSPSSSPSMPPPSPDSSSFVRGQRQSSQHRRYRSQQSMSSVPSAYEITTIGSDTRDTRCASELQVLATFPISVDLMAGKHSGWDFFHPWEYFILVTRRGQKLVALTQLPCTC